MNVLVGNEKIIVRMVKNEWKVGEEVWISINKLVDTVWHKKTLFLPTQEFT